MCKLSVADVRVWVHLGCGDEEKHHPQLVRFDVEITFKNQPQGMYSDQLEDTISYVDPVQQIQMLCQSRRFNLIEHLTSAVYEVLCHAMTPQLESIAWIHVRTHKTAPPVPGIHGGVFFEYGACPSTHTEQRL